MLRATYEALAVGSLLRVADDLELELRLGDGFAGPMGAAA